jgi:hypothetical protein
MPLQKVVVLVNPEFILGNFAVRCWLTECGAFNQYAADAELSVESLLRQWRESASYIPVESTTYESDHQFGPILGIEGANGQSIQIVIPWAQIVGVLIDRTGNMSAGFGALPSGEARSTSRPKLKLTLKGSASPEDTA